MREGHAIEARHPVPADAGALLRHRLQVLDEGPVPVVLDQEAETVHRRMQQVLGPIKSLAVGARLATLEAGHGPVDGVDLSAHPDRQPGLETTLLLREPVAPAGARLQVDDTRAGHAGQRLRRSEFRLHRRAARRARKLFGRNAPLELFAQAGQHQVDADRRPTARPTPASDRTGRGGRRARARNRRSHCSRASRSALPASRRSTTGAA